MLCDETEKRQEKRFIVHIDMYKIAEFVKHVTHSLCKQRNHELDLVLQHQFVHSELTDII